MVIQLPKIFTLYVTNIIAEPKYKYGQQEQVTVRNHKRSIALERSVLKYWGGGLKPVLEGSGVALTSPTKLFTYKSYCFLTSALISLKVSGNYIYGTGSLTGILEQLKWESLKKGGEIIES